MRGTNQPPPNPAEAHAGKPQNHNRIIPGKVQKLAAARAGNLAGQRYEAIAEHILRDYTKTAPNTKGFDFISADAQVRIEVKGTADGKNMGTFSKIKVLNGELMNQIATHFLFITPTHAYLFDADRLRQFVKKNYKKLKTKKFRGDSRLRAYLSILDLINGGVLSTPHGDVQGWRIRFPSGRLAEPMTNRNPLSVGVLKPAKPIQDPEHGFGGVPSHEGMRRRVVTKRGQSRK